MKKLKLAISWMIFRSLFKQHYKEMRLLFADVTQMRKDNWTVYSILVEAEKSGDYQVQNKLARDFLLGGIFPRGLGEGRYSQAPRSRPSALKQASG